jgi:hypothetical protein
LDELRTAVAYIFRKKNVEKLSETEFILTVSMDLHWFTPVDAKKFVDVAVENGVLKRDANILTPCFDTNLCFVPISFTPAHTILDLKPAQKTPVKQKVEDLFSKIVEKLVKSTGSDVQDIIAKINRAKDKYDVEIEVAALLVGMEHNISMAEYLPALEAEITDRFLKAREGR